MNRENAFKTWLERYPDHKYDRSTISGYLGALRNAPQWFDVSISKSLLEMNNSEELRIAANQI